MRVKVKYDRYFLLSIDWSILYLALRWMQNYLLSNITATEKLCASNGVQNSVLECKEIVHWQHINLSLRLRIRLDDMLEQASQLGADRPWWQLDSSTLSWKKISRSQHQLAVLSITERKKGQADRGNKTSPSPNDLEWRAHDLRTRFRVSALPLAHCFFDCPRGDEKNDPWSVECRGKTR